MVKQNFISGIFYLDSHLNTFSVDTQPKLCIYTTFMRFFGILWIP